MHWWGDMIIPLRNIPKRISILSTQVHMCISINVFNSIVAKDGMVILAIEELPMNDITQLSDIANNTLRTTHKGHIQGLGMFLVVSNPAHNLISIHS